MSFLTLTNDELSLLRFTCDLYFVEESPLHFLERTSDGAASGYDSVYKRLVAEGIVDPRGFRVTDEALNRLAPITECDARVVHVEQTADGDFQQTDFYLLDEIAVQYVREDEVHALGRDMDPEQLCVYLARRLNPRRASGPLLDVTLSTTAFVALSTMTRAMRKNHAPLFSTEELTTHRDLRGIGSSRRTTIVDRAALRARTVPAVSPEAALDELVARGLADRHGSNVRARPLMEEFARSLQTAMRETFVRYDFSDDTWSTRELSIVPIEGSLLSMTPTGDGVRIRELDGAILRALLTDTVGPLPREDVAPPRRLLRELLLAVGDDDVSDPTLVSP